MTHESAPILQRINQTANIHDLAPSEIENSRAVGIAIASGFENYNIETRLTAADNFAANYGPLHVSVAADGGMFGPLGPTRAEISSNGRERLLLPGDPGFELIDELHAQTSALAPQIDSIKETVGIKYEGTGSFYFRPQQGSLFHDRGAHTITHRRTHHYGFGASPNDATNMHMFDVNMVTTGPEGLQAPAELLYNQISFYDADDPQHLTGPQQWHGSELINFGKGESWSNPDLMLAFTTLTSMITRLVVEQ